MAKHTLEITFDDSTGAVQVKGAIIANPIVAFGMLAFAHDNIQRMLDRQQQAVQMPSPQDLAALAKKPNGA